MEHFEEGNLNLRLFLFSIFHFLHLDMSDSEYKVDVHAEEQISNTS